MTIDLKEWPEVQQYLPALSVSEKHQLLQSLNNEQVDIPILHLSDGRIIDGHHRWELSNKTYPYLKEIDLPEDKAFALALALNLARRQLTLDQIKQIQQSIKDDKEKQKEIAHQLRRNGKTQEETAAIVGVARRTIDLWEDEQESNTSIVINDNTCIAPDWRVTIAQDHKQIIYDRLQSGETQQSIADDYKVSQQRIAQIKQEVENAGQAKPHIAYNSGENEWYTPEQYIISARNVMGQIDLDPASTEIANNIVKAHRYFTAEDDGLSQHWNGKVWMNPPYARELIGEFIQKLIIHFEINDITEAIVLINNATETKWFQNISRIASALCLPESRIKFWHPEKEAATPLQGQAILYLGDNPQIFNQEFKQYGVVWCKQC